jgi:hypothetical protein
MGRDDFVPPARKRLIGETVAHQAEGLRQLEKLRTPQKRSISPSTGFAMLEEEITETQRNIDDLKKAIVEQGRLPQQSQPELSVRAPFNLSLRLAGAPAWVIALALVVVLALITAVVLLRK